MNWMLCVLIVFLGGCQQKPQETHYKEIVIQPQADSVPASVNFHWETPSGWQQEDGQGMRLATFHLSSDKSAIDCSIVTLAGMAGGLESNIRRWLGQLGIGASDDNVNRLVDTSQILKSNDGLDIKIFDFTSLQTTGNSSDKSMMVAMIVVDSTTIFIKMTGSREAVQKNKGSYLELLRSFIRT